MPVLRGTNQGPAWRRRSGATHRGHPAATPRGHPAWASADEQLIRRMVSQVQDRFRHDARTTVTSTPSATAVPVNTLGTTTSGPSGMGSLKNISTITRT